MSHGARAAIAAAALLLGAFASPPALAESRDPAVATELFNAGRDLMKSGDFAAACPKLAGSLALDAKVGTMARLAECEERIGQLANARAHWAQAINLARSLGDDRLAHVESEWKRLDAMVPKIDVELGAHPPPGASLHVDQLDLGAASFGLPVPVDPGTHSVTVTAEGKRPWSQTVLTARGGAVTRLEVPPLEAAPVVEAVTPAVPPSAPVTGGRRTLRLAAIVTGGAGVLAAGVGAAFAIVAKNDLDASNRDGCAGNNCMQPGYGERIDARSAGDFSTGFFVAGGVLAAAAVTLVVVSSRTEERVTVTAGPGSVRLGCTF